MNVNNELVPGAKLRLNYLNMLVSVFGVIESSEAESLFYRLYGEELYDNQTLRNTIESKTHTPEELICDDEIRVMYDDDYVEGIFTFVRFDDDTEYVCNYYLSDPSIICWVLYIQSGYERYDIINSHCPLFEKEYLLNDMSFNYPFYRYDELKQYISENYNISDSGADLIASATFCTQSHASFPIILDNVLDDVYLDMEQLNVDVNKARNDIHLTYLINEVFKNANSWVYNGNSYNSVNEE